MTETRTYTIQGKRGIDDLKGYMGGQATEWWTEEDWREYNKRQPARMRFNQWYIGWLKRNGRFGEVYETRITLKYNPAFDEPQLFGKSSFTSHKMVFL